MTLEEKIDKLIADTSTIKTDVEVLKEQIKLRRTIGNCEQHDDSLADHEDRLRGIEVDINRFKGSLTTFKVLMGVIISLLLTIIGLMTNTNLNLFN